jgi:hypothetical protein
VIEITPEQLREACVIFVEHKHIQIENDFLKKENSLLIQKTKELNQIITIKDKQINNMTITEFKYQQMLNNHNRSLRELNAQMAKERGKYFFLGGAAGVVVTALLFCLI